MKNKEILTLTKTQINDSFKITQSYSITVEELPKTRKKLFRKSK